MNLYLELFGYIGTALVLLSMMMTSVVKLRWFNTAGSLISMTYALICNTWPVVLLNFGLIVINVIQLIRLRNNKVHFDVVAVKADDATLQYFLDYNREEIQSIFPEFSLAAGPDTVSYMVFAGTEAVGAMVAKRQDTQLQVQLDFATPKYRDCAVAVRLIAQLKQWGITRLTVALATQSHAQYLKKMGFAQKDGQWVKAL